MNASTSSSIAQHTPGRWAAVGSAIETLLDDGTGVLVAHVYDEDENGAIEARANARLIAASPDLLASAEAFLAWFRENAGFFTLRGDDELKRGFEDRARALATACHDATGGRDS